MGVWTTTLYVKNNFRNFCSNVMKYLNVAEKNDAAKNIASILSRGASTRREGLSVYNKIYEFKATVLGQQVQMVMTSVSGHLLNYAFRSAYRSWHSCNPVTLFDAPVIKACPKDFEKIKTTLEREIRSCDGLIIWTDCDREGENIGFEVIEVCTCVKPNITVLRAKFSEITGPSIFRALNTLGQPNRDISNAVDVRQELDLRTGAAFTRLQTLRLQRVFPAKLFDKLISYGSCQFPTLGFVVDRYQTIENFIAEQFWKIKMSHTVKELTTEFSWKRDRLFDKSACESILDICLESNTATVESVDSRPKSKWRPLPLDTVEMEKTISRKLKINAKVTMTVAEKLYQKGFISYPRTETNIYPKELNLANIVEHQREDNRWGPFAQRIMVEGGPTPRAGKKSDQAHPPIHPTKYATGLAGNEAQVYEYIVRHFLASVHKDAQGFETTVNVDIAAEKFTAKGLIVLEKNYLDVYIYDRWNTKEINNYSEGDVFTPTVLEMAEGNTSPPKLLTEADLIALMEKHGIGTDATHAEHIETIKSREYVGMHENIYFVPGTLGMGLVEGYNNIGLEVSLAKPTLRADFENDLKLICEGRKDPEVVRLDQIAKYKAVFQIVADRMVELDNSLANRLDDVPTNVPVDVVPAGAGNENRPVLKCPKCGNDMVLRNKKNGPGQFLSCTGYPECRNAGWFSGAETISVLDESCPQCGPSVNKVKIKFRQNPFVGEPNPNVFCIGGCDLNVLESLDISPTVVRQPNANSIPNPLNNRQSILNVSNRNPVEIRPDDRSSTNRNNGRATVDSRGSSYVVYQNADVMRNNRLNQSTLDELPAFSGNASASNVTVATSNDDIVCSCNENALLLTVRKEGPNKGRKFYKCQNSVCNFFLWAPEENDKPSSIRPSVRNNTTMAMQSHNSTVKCNCDEPAILRTVSKQGNNVGRQFYCCHKPMGDSAKCSFFKWADEADSGGNDNDDDSFGGGSRWGGGGGSGSTSSWGGKKNTSWKGKAKSNKKKPSGTDAPYNKTRAKRKCGICGEEGHIRTKCPN